MDNYIERNRKRNENSGESSKGTVEKRKKYRKYDDQYLDFGFTYITKGNIEHPQCVVCHQVLAAESMLPNKLKRHLETTHSHLRGKHSLQSPPPKGNLYDIFKIGDAMVSPGRPLMIKKGGANIEIKDDEYTLNRLTGLCAAYFASQGGGYIPRCAMAVSLGQDVNRDKILYHSAAPGSENFPDIFIYHLLR
ncbi:hypothetical protein ACJJTC_008833 [Scirpophaga incertulas]